MANTAPPCSTSPQASSISSAFGTTPPTSNPRWPPAWACAGIKNRSVFGYYLYDFWNDEFLGEISGNSIISRPLKPQQSLVYALRRKFDRPQVISTNRHIMQGLLDPATWNPVTLTLSGTTRVVAGEPAVITLAGNGYQPVTPERADISITRDGDLVKLTLTSDTTTDVAWSLVWKK